MRAPAEETKTLSGGEPRKRPRKEDGKTWKAAAPPDEDQGKAKVREVVVRVWQGPVDWQEVEPRLLLFMRTYDARSSLTQAELARRLKMDRRLLRKLHVDMKICTVGMLCRWCNGRRLDPSYLLFLAIESLRQEAEKRDSRKQAKKCRL